VASGASEKVAGHSENSCYVGVHSDKKLISALPCIVGVTIRCDAAKTRWPEKQLKENCCLSAAAPF